MFVVACIPDTIRPAILKRSERIALLSRSERHRAIADSYADPNTETVVLVIVRSTR